MSSPVFITNQDSLATTDATVTKVLSFNAANDGVYAIVLDVLAFNETDGTAYIQKTYRGFKRVSGTVTALAAQTTIVGEGDATITVTIANIGDELYVELTGVAAKTIDWNINTVLRYT